MQKFRNHHSGVKILSLIKLMIYQFRGIFMGFTAVINAGLSVNRTSALVPYGDLALAVTRIVSLKNPIGIRKVSHLVWILNRLVIHLTSDVSTFDLFCQPFWSFFFSKMRDVTKFTAWMPFDCFHWLLRNISVTSNFILDGYTPSSVGGFRSQLDKEKRNNYGIII